MSLVCVCASLVGGCVCVFSVCVRVCVSLVGVCVVHMCT